MTSSPSLQNKTVLNPRGKSSAKSFSNMVRKYGGIPVEIPLLDFKAIVLTTEQKAQIDKIHTYDWLIFTSKVTVDVFLPQLSCGVENLPKIAAIGEKTAEVLTTKGISVDFIPTKYVAEAFVVEFAHLVKSGTKIFIPKGNLARDLISSELMKLGVQVDEMLVYDTVFPPENKAKLAGLLAEHGLEIIPFTSPSTVDHFMEVVEEYGLQDNVRTCIFACIGPVAKKRAEKWGLPIHAVPEVYTVDEMLKSVACYLNKNCVR